MRRFALTLWLILCLPVFAADSCYDTVVRLGIDRLKEPEKQHVYAYGTKVPIAHAFEKEGLFYDDIDHWFPRIDDVGKGVLRQRLADEKEGKKPKLLHRWLKKWPDEYRPAHYPLMPKDAKTLTPDELLNRLVAEGNPFDAINMKGKEAIIYEQILTFDHVRPGPNTPEWLTVADDIGSYEVKTAEGTADRSLHYARRDFVEEGLDSAVGHQHLVHAWPENEALRQAIAPHYIELLDASTWYLYLRQLARNPSEVGSIVEHPYLGIYSRNGLDKLFDAMMKGEPAKFKNKYRMIGARALSPDPKVPEQAGHSKLPDWELRSGNKSDNRDFVEDMLEARLSSGDYTGLRDYRESKFDPNAPVEELFKGRITDSEMETLRRFQREFGPMKYSGDSRAYNHIRNKLIAPMLPWNERIDLGFKKDIVSRAQDRFAKGMADIAKKHLRRLPHAKTREQKINLNRDTLDAVEKLNYQFASRTRLDENFEKYLRVLPSHVADVNYKPLIDVNEVDLGIEYSFRFPTKPKAKSTAAGMIERAATAFRDALGGGTVTRQEDGGHGHGLSVKYEVKGPDDQTWRVEWDGIKRTYVEGSPKNPRFGHIEVPSPRFAPKDTEAIETLFQAMRDEGLFPKRAAGGGHVNVDLTPLKALPEKQGARAMADLIAYFESNREMTQYLWQHPFRSRVAIPVEYEPGFAKALNDFNGGWDDLARLLYDHKYFNPLEGRKPVYTQLNAAAVMDPVIPDELRQPIDIKNPNTEWFPSFGGKGKDRIEFRLFDAPTDENMAALQIKYVRAMLNRAFNGGKQKLVANYDDYDTLGWELRPKDFYQAAKSHLEELGLNADEFAPVIADAGKVQKSAKPFTVFRATEKAGRGGPEPMDEGPMILTRDWNPKSLQKGDTFQMASARSSFLPRTTFRVKSVRKNDKGETVIKAEPANGDKEGPRAYVVNINVSGKEQSMSLMNRFFTYRFEIGAP